MTAKIDQAICGLCLGCAVVCPEELFYFVDEQLRIAEGCIACGYCVECCPVKAISL